MSKAEQRYLQPMVDTIRSRHSIRTFDGKPLSDEHREQLTRFMNNLQAQSGIGLRLKLVDSDIALQETGARLGTYGVIKGVSSYIVSALNKNINNIEDFGYCFEQLILFATSIGLGTCWMAMTMKRNEFAKAIELKDDEFIPIVSPIGYPAQALGLTDFIFRTTARSNSRKSWSDLFFSSNLTTPLSEAEAGYYSLALAMARLAPSASNHQPWRIIKENDTFHFYLQRTKGYRNKFLYDIQRLDVGIAMCHFELTLIEQGLKGIWVFQEPNIDASSQERVYIKSWIKSE